MAKITFVVDEMAFKVAIINSSVIKITIVVTEITFSVVDIGLLMANITFVAFVWL